MPYPHLRRACQQNQRLLADIIAIVEEFPGLPSYLDSLVNELFNLGCLNILGKFSEGQISQIFPLIAELIAARHFLEKGFETEFLQGNIFQGRSPDILIRKDGLERLVEVTHLKSSDSVDYLIQKCRRFFKNRPFRVDIEFRNNLSPPYLNREERDIQSACIERSLRQFREQYDRISGEDFPSIIETDDIIFTLHKIESGHGYPAILRRSFSVDPDFASRYLTRRLSEKADKRRDFPPPYRNLPYILCLVSSEDAIDSLMLQELLYGQTIEYGRGTEIRPTDQANLDAIRERRWREIVDNYPQTCPYWDDILEAERRGSSRILEDNCLIPHSYRSVTDFGIFLSDAAMRNVSGVLFVQREKQQSFFMNPFCDVEIFDNALASI